MNQKDIGIAAAIVLAVSAAVAYFSRESGLVASGESTAVVENGSSRKKSIPLEPSSTTVRREVSVNDGLELVEAAEVVDESNPFNLWMGKPTETFLAAYWQMSSEELRNDLVEQGFPAKVIDRLLAQSVPANLQEWDAVSSSLQEEMCSQLQGTSEVIGKSFAQAGAGNYSRSLVTLKNVLADRGVAGDGVEVTLRDEIEENLTAIHEAQARYLNEAVTLIAAKFEAGDLDRYPLLTVTRGAQPQPRFEPGSYLYHKLSTGKQNWIAQVHLFRGESRVLDAAFDDLRSAWRDAIVSSAAGLFGVTLFPSDLQSIGLSLESP
ncbi:MAG: hypothetical protein ACYS26_07145 [Planctomycetota bacterium]|jgi:hypothetical protein